MIIKCLGCEAKYFLSDDKIPSKPVKVRCPKCGAVFRLKPPSNENEGLAGGSVRGVLSSKELSTEKAAVSSKTAASVSVEEQPHETPGKSSRHESKDNRAKRLARVLISDILWYNKEKRDQALIDGNLMAVLGEEIKKSWELYKEKVGPELANSTGYFKEALNEILANGQKIF